MPEHPHCVPWCDRSHDPRNACYAELATARSADDTETPIGLYGTALGVHLAVAGRAISSAAATTLMLAWAAERARLEAYDRTECQIPPGGIVPEHMSWCDGADHHEIACGRIVLEDQWTTVSIEGAPGEQVGLTVRPAFTREPTPMYMAGGWGGQVNVVAPVPDSELFMCLAELEVFARAFEAAGPLLHSPARQDPG